MPFCLRPQRKLVTADENSHHQGYNRGGWNDYGYYQPRRYYRPRYVRYYQPRYYAPPSFFQIGFAFGGQSESAAGNQYSV